MAKSVKVMKQGSFGSAYLVTYVGAAVYFVDKAHGFWGTIGGLIEAAVWPGFFVYHVLALLHA